MNLPMVKYFAVSVLVGFIYVFFIHKHIPANLRIVTILAITILSVVATKDR